VDNLVVNIANIVGTWRLVMTRAHDDAGEPMLAPYGPKPMGIVVFSADGRMIAVLCDGRLVEPAGPVPDTLEQTTRRGAPDDLLGR